MLDREADGLVAMAEARVGGSRAAGERNFDMKTARGVTREITGKDGIRLGPLPSRSSSG